MTTGKKEKGRKPKEKIYLVVETEYRGGIFLQKHRGGAPDVHARSFSSAVLLCSVHKIFSNVSTLCVFSCFWFCSDMVRFSLCSTIFSFFLFLFYCHFLTRERERDKWMRPTKTMTFFRCREECCIVKKLQATERERDGKWKTTMRLSRHIAFACSHT